jgi:hypothetical protein
MAGPQFEEIIPPPLRREQDRKPNRDADMVAKRFRKVIDAPYSKRRERNHRGNQYRKAPHASGLGHPYKLVAAFRTRNTVWC